MLPPSRKNLPLQDNTLLMTQLYVNLEPTDAESTVTNNVQTNSRMQSNPAKIRRSNYHTRSQDDAIDANITNIPTMQLP